MSERIFVQVIGFADVERHALNTVFRLSDERVTSYALWTPEMPGLPALALVDGQSPEGRQLLETGGIDPQIRLFWVGAIAPARAERSFARPLNWTQVVAAMDEIFSPPPAVDFDLDFEPPAPPPDESGKRVLIAGADADERFYLRAKLSSVGLLQADEADTPQAIAELLKAHRYAAILLDLDFPQADGMQVLRGLIAGLPDVPVIALSAHLGLWGRLRARMAGAKACLGKPPHPGRLQALLQAV